MRRLLLPLLFLPLLGCDLLGGDSPEPPATTGSRPSDAPDFVVLAASGHALNISAFPYRDSYLIQQGAALDVASALEDLGSTVFVWDHGDALWNHDASGVALSPLDAGTPESFGFLQLVVDLETIRDQWIASFDDPTRIVVVGHSHGVVWAHTAMQLVPDAPVDVLIDLDGDVDAWDSQGPLGVAWDGWDQELADYTASVGVSWPFDASAARDGWTVPGQEQPLDVEDVVPASATLNLEVWGREEELGDRDPNLRVDGSDLGVLRLETSLGQDDLARGGTEATAWITEQLAEFYGP